MARMLQGEYCLLLQKEFTQPFIVAIVMINIEEFEKTFTIRQTIMVNRTSVISNFSYKPLCRSLRYITAMFR